MNNKAHTSFTQIEHSFSLDHCSEGWSRSALLV